MQFKQLDADKLKITHIAVQKAAKTRRRTYRAHGRINGEITFFVFFLFYKMCVEFSFVCFFFLSCVSPIAFKAAPCHIEIICTESTKTGQFVFCFLAFYFFVFFLLIDFVFFSSEELEEQGEAQVARGVEAGGGGKVKPLFRRNFVALFTGGCCCCSIWNKLVFHCSYFGVSVARC